MRDACERYHDHVANIYDDMYSKNPYWDFYHQVSWNHMKAYLPRDLSVKVHDAGCGTGLYGLKLLKAGFHVLFSDLSRKMLDVALRKAAAAGYADRATYEKIDMADMSTLPDDGFGLICAQGDPLSLCTNPRKAMREIARTLAPGGRAVLSVDNRTSGYAHYLEKNDLAGLSDFHKTGRLTWLAERRDERFPFQTFSGDDLAGLAQKAHLEVVSLIGKTILPVRKHPELLDDPQAFQALVRIEKKLSKQPANLGMAAHLQVVLEKPVD